ARQATMFERKLWQTGSDARHDEGAESFRTRRPEPRRSEPDFPTQQWFANSISAELDVTGTPSRVTIRRSLNRDTRKVGIGQPDVQTDVRVRVRFEQHRITAGRFRPVIRRQPRRNLQIIIDVEFHDVVQLRLAFGAKDANARGGALFDKDA